MAIHWWGRIRQFINELREKFHSWFDLCHLRLLASLCLTTWIKQRHVVEEKKKLISVFAEAESNCNRELVFLFSKNFQEFNVIVKNVVNICTDLLSVLTWFGEGILVLKKKILSSCAGYCTAKKHILFFSEVNTSLIFFRLNSVKYFTYFIHTNQTEKLPTASNFYLKSPMTILV